MADTEAPEAPGRHLTYAEVQTVLGIKKTRFYELIKAGEIDRVDISRNSPGQGRPIGKTGPRPTWRVPESSLRAYIERNHVPTP